MFDKVNFPITWQRVGSSEMKMRSLNVDALLGLKVEIATWNPDKDLLAMVTRDHQLIVHRFNWQRLWAVSPGLNFQLPNMLNHRWVISLFTSTTRIKFR